MTKLGQQKQQLQQHIHQLESELASASKHLPELRRAAQEAYDRSPDNVIEYWSDPRWSESRKAGMKAREEAQKALKEATKKCATIEEKLAPLKTELVELEANPNHVKVLRDEISQQQKELTQIQSGLDELHGHARTAETMQKAIAQRLQHIERQRATLLSPDDLRDSRNAYEAAQREQADNAQLITNLQAAIQDTTTKKTQAQMALESVQQQLAHTLDEQQRQVVRKLAAAEIQKAYALAQAAGTHVGSMAEFAAKVFADVPVNGEQAA